MKTAYELAMERLNKTAPIQKLNPDQKKAIAEAETQAAAKIAGREVFLKGEMEKAISSGDDAGLEQLEKQLVNERKALQAELEDKKEQLRRRG